jgi:ribosomal-protein-alanine N-acetyltransferase
VVPFDLRRHLDGLLAVEAASFVNPSGRAHYEWEHAHSDVARVSVVIDEGGVVLGFCAAWLIFDELHINTMAIAPHRRRGGLGRQLLQSVLDASRAEGAVLATLEVRASNLPARALYEAFGFRQAGVRRGYYTHPADDALILTRRLDAVAPIDAGPSA